jgi:hypothetical protein
MKQLRQDYLPMLLLLPPPPLLLLLGLAVEFELLDPAAAVGAELLAARPAAANDLAPKTSQQQVQGQGVPVCIAVALPAGTLHPSSCPLLSSCDMS